MATSGCSPVGFVNIWDNAFLFQEKRDEDLDEDCWEKSELPLKNYLVQSRDNKFLLISPELQFEVQNLTIYQQSQTDCKFIIQAYNAGGKERRAAMLYVNVNGKNMVVCCNPEHDIYPKEMGDLPSSIDGTTSVSDGNMCMSLFYMTTVVAPSNSFMFESSMFPSEFLGFESVDNGALKKLVLRRKRNNQVDTLCYVTLLKCE